MRIRSKSIRLRNGSRVAVAAAVFTLGLWGGVAQASDGNAPSLVDGRVGVSPFYDDESSVGSADGSLVTAGGAGAPVSISWSAAALQVDGKAAAQVSGYRLYFGHNPGSYDYVIEVADPAAQSYTLPDLPRGTYYFTATAVDASGHEGPHSDVAAITI